MHRRHLRIQCHSQYDGLVGPVIVERKGMLSTGLPFVQVIHNHLWCKTGCQISHDHSTYSRWDLTIRSHPPIHKHATMLADRLIESNELEWIRIDQSRTSMASLWPACDKAAVNIADSQRRIGYSPLIFLAINSSAKNRRVQPCAFWTKITAPLFTFIQLLLTSGVNSCEIANKPSKNWLLSTNATEELRGYAVHGCMHIQKLRPGQAP